jgi:hypothetical protein
MIKIVLFNLFLNLHLIDSSPYLTRSFEDAFKILNENELLESSIFFNDLRNALVTGVKILAKQPFLSPLLIGKKISPLSKWEKNSSYTLVKQFKLCTENWGVEQLKMTPKMVF